MGRENIILKNVNYSVRCSRQSRVVWIFLNAYTIQVNCQVKINCSSSVDQVLHAYGIPKQVKRGVTDPPTKMTDPMTIKLVVVRNV